MTVGAHRHSHGGTDSEHDSHERHAGNVNTMALSATLHCLTGCAIGEIAGLMLGTALGLGNLATIALAVGLAFLFGYTLSTLPLLRAGLVNVVFWVSMMIALAVAFLAAYPVNRYLLGKGKGHALTLGGLAVSIADQLDGSDVGADHAAVERSRN